MVLMTGWDELCGCLLCGRHLFFLWIKDSCMKGLLISWLLIISLFGLKAQAEVFLDTVNGEIHIPNVEIGWGKYQLDLQAVDIADSDWQQWTFTVGNANFSSFPNPQDQALPLFNLETGMVWLPTVTVDEQAYDIGLRVKNWRQAKREKTPWQAWELELEHATPILEQCGSYNLVMPPQGVCPSRSGSLLPSLTGPYCVGTTNIHVQDNSRQETYAESGQTGPRELMLRVWYPIEQDAVGTPTDYMDAESYDWMINAFYLGNVFELPEDSNEQIRPNSLEAAPIATGKFPVLLFSPGLFYITSSYAAFIEDLVSHGYIVVAVNHPYISGITIFPDGRSVGPLNTSELTADEIKQMIEDGFHVMVDDISFVLDYLEMLNRGETEHSMWECQMDMSRIGMFGHSLGGAVGLQMCAQDLRVRACANMDGIPHGDVIEQGTSKPVLIMRSVKAFENIDYWNLWKNLDTGDAYSAVIAGTGHTSYSDVAIMLEHFLPWLPRAVLGAGYTNPKYVAEITNQFHLKFFNAYLKGDSLATFTALSYQFPEVKVNSKAYENSYKNY